MQMNDPLEFSPWQNNPLDWMTRELNKKNAKLKGYTPRYNKSVPFDRIFKYDTNVVTKNPASVNYMKPFSFDLTYTKMNTERPKLVDKYVNNSTNKRLRITDRMRKMVGDVKVNRAVDMSNIPSEEQDKVLKILGMTESQLKDTPPENYFGTRIGRTGAKEQVIYNFDLWMQYPVLNQDPSHLELNERYRINYAYGSPLVMGSIQARTIWIQKSVYKPINWNDVDKGNVETHREIIPTPNLFDPRFDPSVLGDLSEEEEEPVVIQPEEPQITETNIPHDKNELRNNEVYDFCAYIINKCKNYLDSNTKIEFCDAVKHFVIAYNPGTRVIDTVSTRYREKLVNALKYEFRNQQESDVFKAFKAAVQSENNQQIIRILNKIESKRGDTGHDAFWEHCKRKSNEVKYYSDNIEMPIIERGRKRPHIQTEQSNSNNNNDLPNPNSVLDADLVLPRPPEPTQPPNPFPI